MKFSQANSLKLLSKEMPSSSGRHLSEDVLDYLREAITRGYFDAGEHLTEPSLAQLLGVSRGPIREALVELDREGLVHLQRRKGATVTRLTAHDIEEIYGLRGALERLAVERVVHHATDEDFAEMDTIIARFEKAVQEADVRQVVETDVAFHDLLYRSARHSRLHNCWANLRSQVLAFLLSSATLESGYLDNIVPEHSKIRDVLKAREELRAIELNQAHLDHAYMRLVKNLDKSHHGERSSRKQPS